jgi:hypothetical protein
MLKKEDIDRQILQNKKSIRSISRYDLAKNKRKEALDKVKKKMFSRRRRSRHHSIIIGSDQMT